MKHPRRIDENQPGIVKALRSIGCSVLSLASIGKGCPDLLVRRSERLFLIEVKNPTKPKADRQLTPAEREWIDAWGGPVHIIETAEQAIELVTQ